MTMTGSKPLRNSPRKASVSSSTEVQADALTSDFAPRKTGIRVMEDAPWGTHMCIFYETKQDLLDMTVSYLEAGLRSHELCVWAISGPITKQDAKNALRRAIPDFDRYLAAGQIELIPGREWYLKGGGFDMRRVTSGWHAKLNAALAKGFEGMRASGDAFWLGTKQWKEFYEYEQELDRSIAGRKMIVLCAYSLHASKTVDMLDVARAHQFSIVRRKGDWEFLETPELKLAKQEIRRLNGALDILSKPFPGRETLTPKERVALAQIVRGFSSKEIARSLGISPRTVEFHRTNLLSKTGAKNTVDLVRKVLAD
jgi:DNA-binding CsgD family transcriptional regulator